MHATQILQAKKDGLPNPPTRREEKRSPSSQPFRLSSLSRHHQMRSLIGLPSLPCLPLKNPNVFSNPIPSLSFHTTHLSILPKPTFKLHSSSSSSSSSSPSISLADLEPAAEIASEKFDWHSNWYPVAVVCDLDKRAPRGLTILGLDVVVWWDREGDRWQVFDDRCPHRLAPLSEGRIDKWGRLQCVYHGWCFDGSGGCKYIPQAPPDGPPVHAFNKACAAVYPSFIQNKILWFWPNTDPKYKNILEKEKPPYVAEVDDPSYSCTTGTRDLHYGYDVLVENLMDPAHVPYAHHKIMRTPKRPGGPLPDREGGRPLEMNIETLNVNGFLSKQQFGCSKFIAPCFYFAYPFLGSSNGSVSPSDTKENSSAKVQQKTRRALLIFYCIPVSPGKSRVIWVFPRNFAVWIDKVIPRWILHIGNNLILDSDLYLLHVEEHKIAEAGPANWQKACFVPTKSDAQVIAFRNWFRKYSDNHVNFGAKFTGLLPPTPPREQLMDRYWTHVVNCDSCHTALKGLKVLEVVLQVISISAIGVLAAAKEKIISTAARTAIVSMALVFFMASKWLAHFIYRNFYYHDYNHAFV